MLLVAAFVGLAILLAVSALILGFARAGTRRKPVEDEPRQEVPEAVFAVRELLPKIEDLLTSRLSAQTTIILEAEGRVKSELIEQACRIETLAEGVRQNSKELAVIEQLLRDIIQILNISISETKGLSAKVQKQMDERPGAQAIEPRPRQLR
jgi:hypothetical protein